MVRKSGGRCKLAIAYLLFVASFVFPTFSVFKVVYDEYLFAFSVMSVIPQSQERILRWPPYLLLRLDQEGFWRLVGYPEVIRGPLVSALRRAPSTPRPPVRQTMHSIGRSMDCKWTTTWLAVCSSALHLQAANGKLICMSRSGKVRHRCVGRVAGPTLFLAGSFQEGGLRCRDESTESRSVLQPLRIPSVIRQERHTSVSHFCTEWSRWQGVLETAWLLYDEAQQVWCPRR